LQMLKFRSRIKQFLYSIKPKNLEDLMNECAYLRGNMPELIHRTIHEFNWFVSNLIFNKDEIYKDMKELFKIPESEPFFKVINDFHYPKKHQFTVLVRFFNDYCRIIYNKYLKPEDYL